MTDGLTTQSTTPATIPENSKIATDDAGASGHVQIIKLAQSADGSATAISADADGLLVNLGANNDVTVTGAVSVSNFPASYPVTDNAGSLTVDGSVAVSNFPASYPVTDNAGSLTVDDGGLTLSVDDGAGSLTVDGTVAATQSGTWDIGTVTGITNVVHVDDNSGSLTVDGTVAVSGTVAVTDNSGSLTVDGSVSIGAALPAGTNIIGSVKLTDGTTVATVRELGANDALNVAMVDGSGNQVTSFGGGTQYTEGDTDASITGTAVMWEDSGDTLRSVSAAKPLPVNVVAGGAGDGSILDGVSSGIKATVLDYANSNPLAVRLTDTSGDYVGAGAGTQYTEDAAAAADPIGTMVMAVRADTPGAVTTTDGDNIAARATNKGELYVKHIDAIPVTDNAGSLTVDGTVTASLAAGTNNIGDVDVLSIAAGDNNIGNVDIVTVPAPLSTTGGGTEAAALRVTLANDSTGVVSVDDNGGTLTVDGTVAATQSGTWNVGTVTSITNAVTVNAHAVTNAGTFAVQESGAALTALQLIDDTVATDGSATPTKGILIAGQDGTNAQTIKTDVNGELQVDVLSMPTTTVQDGGGSLTVDGTVAVSGTVAVTQSGTWDEVGINDSGNSITVDAPVATPVFVRLSDGAAAITTLPVSVASVPSHAVTNAGTFAVQESGAALTALQLIDDAVATTAGTIPAKGLAVSGTDGTNARVLKTDTNGELQVDVLTLPNVTIGAAIPAGTNNIGDVDVTSIVPGTGATNLGKAEDAGHTSGDVGVMAMTVRQNTAAALSGTDADYQPLITDTNGRLHVLDGNSATALTSLQLIDDPVIADDAAFTPATTKVMMAGFEADETSTDSVDEGDGGAARMTLDRKQIVNPQPHSAGGMDVMNANTGDTYTALTNSAQAIKASAGQIYGWYIYNPNATAAYVMIYNIAAASVTVGTSTAKMILCIPATAAANLSGTHGITFDTAISAAAATTGGGNTAPTTALEAMFFCK